NSLRSGPNGGIETGGILRGRTEREQDRTITVVEEFEPVACADRHGAYGAYYASSINDVDFFDAVMARPEGDGALPVVGYYRSHNRDGLFLSAGDVRLIERHFRPPESVFLLVKPLPNGACTAGFFFWKDGCLRSEFTDSEAPLIPVSISSTGPSLLSAERLDGISVLPVPRARSEERRVG